jgi:hypothetical protein
MVLVAAQWKMKWHGCLCGTIVAWGKLLMGFFFGHSFFSHHVVADVVPFIILSAVGELQNKRWQINLLSPSFHSTRPQEEQISNGFLLI